MPSPSAASLRPSTSAGSCDRFGRKPILMLDIVSYSVVGGSLRRERAERYGCLALRALFGIAMGGEWGLGLVRPR